MIEPSLLESARFDLRIGRWTPTTAGEAAAPGDFDVVIVRRPSGWVDSWYGMTIDDGFVAIHADTLIYWEWLDLADALIVPGELGSNLRTDAGELADLVRATFAGYQNHYVANPLLDPADALEGYVEWAVHTADAAGGWLALTSGTDTAGFAAVDWAVDPPDVRLAGVHPAHQGRGLYRSLVTTVMAAARARGARRIAISTQSHNIRPQRVWSSLGWRPSGSTETVHLVRRALLRAGRALP